jgi:hypothetical protein
MIWLGDNVPPAKEYFYKKAKRMFPDFEVKLYRNKDVTRTLFPFTYDIAQTLM